MRTTLKRGTGGGNGNGLPALPPPAAPPPIVSPVTRYSFPRRGPLWLVGKIVLWICAVLLVAAGALGGGVWLWLNESVSAVRAHTPEAREAQKILDTPLPGQPTVAMVVGYDLRAGDQREVGSTRSDTVMLIRGDPQRESISLLSFPRDLVVDIPACKGHDAFRGRINEAYTYCGPKGTLQTVKELTSIPINYMITVNFRGFRQIVDKVGGVYMDIDRRYFNDNAGLGPGQTYATIDLSPGYQRLWGGAALDYVRYRHTDSDFYRIRRQQQFVVALKQQVQGFSSLAKLPGIVNTITENVEVGVGGGGTLDFDTVYGYAKLAYQLPSGNFQQITIDTEKLAGYAEISAPEEAIQETVARFLNPDVSAAVKAANAATGRKPATPVAPKSSEVTLEVLNGNGVAGAADDAGYLLGLRGYQVVNGGNADRFDYFRTKVLYDPASPEGKAAAEAVASLFGDADIEPASPSAPLETTLRVVVGQTFHGTIGPAPVETTPEHTAPTVERDPGDVRPLLVKAQRRVDFPLLVPTLRDETSSLDGEAGVRVYRVNGHDAVRVVYRTGGGEYWGVQQASWTDPPVLAGPSLVRTIAGREYRLYFNGSKLHMVAFADGNAVYWVVNTLLDRLSNETMLAIGKGLQPLGSAR